MNNGGIAKVFYDDLADDLIVKFVVTNAVEVVHPFDEWISLIYENATGSVVGFQIEAFEHSFVKHHQVDRENLAMSVMVHVFAKMGNSIISRIGR